MPNTKAAIKALRQNKRNQTRNIERKRAIKEVIKSYNRLVVGGDKKGAADKLGEVYKKLDKAAKVNLIKKSKAARIKSRLAKKADK